MTMKTNTDKPSSSDPPLSAKDLGWAVPGWTGATSPDPRPVEGNYCRIEPLRLAYAPDLHDAHRADVDGVVWDYLPYGPFDSLGDFETFLTETCLGSDPLFYAIIDLASGRAIGMASYLRIDPPNGVIEIGHINYAPALQRTPTATEVMYLMMRQVFDRWGTTWFSILDSEWSAARQAFESWLGAVNFDAAGRQRVGLAALRDRGGP